VARSKQRTSGQTQTQSNRREKYPTNTGTHIQAKQKQATDTNPIEEMQMLVKERNKQVITKGKGTTTHHKKEKRQSQQQHVTKTRNTVPYIKQGAISSGKTSSVDSPHYVFLVI